MEEAINEIKTKRTSFLKQAEKFGTSKSTLNVYFINENAGKISRSYFYYEETEKLIAKSIILAWDYGFPLFKFDVRVIVKVVLGTEGFCRDYAKMLKDLEPTKSQRFFFPLRLICYF